MENNTNLDVQETSTVGSTAEPQVDYKALYEKLQKDNANLDRYNKDLKQKYQAKLTDEEKTRASQEERENYYKSLEKEMKSIKYKSELSKTINNTDLVNSISEKFLNDDIFGGLEEINKFFNGEKVNYEKQIKEQSLLKNPTPPPATGKVANVTQAEFNKMNYTQKVELKQNNPELYKQLANR